MVDKDLFLHDLSVVAILKNEGPYLKEWLDYHLLAGVDHFYLYDNDSTDNQFEVAKPYVEAGLVDYIHAPGRIMQYPAYNDAIKKFKFHCRYMAFIDGDEFIYPKTNRPIIEIVDEILSGNPTAAGLAINWQIFGSNGQEEADYSRGVLERFTRRAKKDWSDQCPQGYLAGNIHVKTIANPRMIRLIENPHFPVYFPGFHSVNENGNVVQWHDNNPVTTEKIVVNHYYTKSAEEFRIKQSRGRSSTGGHYDDAWYNFYNRNDEFDDGILKYRAARAENFSLKNDEEKLQRVIVTLTETLSAYASGQIFSLQTALTCRALSTYLREKFPDETPRWKIYEEASFAAIIKSLGDMTLRDNQNLQEEVANAWLLIQELPILLGFSYPVVKEFRAMCLDMLPRLMYIMKCSKMWKKYFELNYVQDLLKLGG